jgi:hypothetical protein
MKNIVRTALALVLGSTLMACAADANDVAEDVSEGSVAAATVATQGMLVSGEAATDEQASDNLGVSIHDNEVWLTTHGDRGMVFDSFDMSDHAITAGQPWDGVTVNKDSNGLHFNIKAGRKNDYVSSTFFNQATASWGVQGSRGDDAINPDKLNFAIKGTVHGHYNGAAFACEMVVGQGSNALGNTWWFAMKPTQECRWVRHTFPSGSVGYRFETPNDVQIDIRN